MATWTCTTTGNLLPFIHIFCYFFLNSHIFTFSHLVTCCGSIQLSTTNADFLSVGVYANYIKGTWTPNGTIFNERYFLFLLALIKAGLLIQSHMDFYLFAFVSIFCHQPITVQPKTVVE